MNYTWRCTICDVHVEISRPVAECRNPPSSEEACMCVTPDWKRVYEMPGLTKASYLDGQRKFTDFREANRLQREAVKSSSNQKKDEIAAEIRKIGVRVGATKE